MYVRGGGLKMSERIGMLAMLSAIMGVGDVNSKGLKFKLTNYKKLNRPMKKKLRRKKVRNFFCHC